MQMVEIRSIRQCQRIGVVEDWLKGIAAAHIGGRDLAIVGLRKDMASEKYSRAGIIPNRNSARDISGTKIMPKAIAISCGFAAPACSIGLRRKVRRPQGLGFPIDPGRDRLINGRRSSLQCLQRPIGCAWRGPNYLDLSAVQKEARSAKKGFHQ